MTAAQWIVLIGTTFTGIAGCLTAYSAIVKAKKETRTEAEIECYERLKAARISADEDYEELRRLRREQQA